jgi:hypothetical protein
VTFEPPPSGAENAAPYGRHTHTQREKGAGCQEQRSGGGRGHGDTKWPHRWRQSVRVMGGKQLTPGSPASACAAALGRRPGHPPRPDRCDPCCKQAKARDQSTHRHKRTDTERSESARPNKNETGVSRNRALVSLSLSLWQNGRGESGGVRTPALRRPIAAENAAPYGRHRERERDRGQGNWERHDRRSRPSKSTSVAGVYGLPEVLERLGDGRQQLAQPPQLRWLGPDFAVPKAASTSPVPTGRQAHRRHKLSVHVHATQ